MKLPPSDDALAGSLPVWPPTASGREPKESLFSLLLEIESRLRAETRSSIRQAAKQQAVKEPFNQRPAGNNLSRYVE